MPYPLPLTRTEAYLAYKAGVIQQSDLKPSLAVPRNGIDAWLAYWTGLAADYPKREDGTPHILQEEEAYIAYLCGVIDTYPEKCLRRVGAYLRYIISARWGRPDHPLNREELYLSLIKTQFIPSGDPSSDIVIDGTAKASFVDVKMYGDTFQQTYTGKNLLKFVPSTAGLNGLTVSYNEASGVVRVSGTPTQNWSNIDSTTKTMSLPAGSYILSVDNPSPLYRLNFRVYDPTASGGYYDFHGGDGGNYIKFTISHDLENVIMRVYIDHNYDQVDVDWSFKIMLESGSDITLPYEPYVGGTPSPNPDYPQPVQTVTGLQTVEVKGKNLFDKNHPNNSPCYVNNSGILTRGSGTNLSVYIPCEPSTTYTVSKSNTGTNNRFCVFDTETKPAVGVSVISTVGTRVGEDNSASYTFTTGANAHYLGVFYRAAVTTPSESEIKDTIQIEKGSTATAYTPYSKHAYPIDLGPIELCKLGAYQDYIWKDSDTWKVHKATDKYVFNGNEQWTWDDTRAPRLYLSSGILANLGIHAAIPPNSSTLPIGKTNRFIAKTFQSFYTDSEGDGFAMSTSGQNFQIGDNSWTSEESAKADVEGLEWIYALATGYATDTAITDTNLIAELEALVKGGSEEGTTYIKVSATDPNLPGLLYVEAAKYV